MAKFNLPDFGSFPFSINWSEVKKVASAAALTAVAAVVAFLISYLGGIETSDDTVKYVLVTACVFVLRSIQVYLLDTRPKEEKLKLPYQEYKKLNKEQKKAEKAKLKN